MSMHIDFLARSFDGATAELYSTAMPWAPLQSVPIQDGVARFTSNAPQFAVRIRNGGHTLLRTGLQNHLVGSSDSSGTFVARFVGYRPTSASDTTLALSTLTAGIQLPLVQNGLTVTALSLATVAGNIRATGSGHFVAGVLGTVPFDFTYTFDLVPDTGALSTRLVTVQTIDASIVGTSSGGLMAWIRNWIITYITIMFNSLVALMIEATVQAQVDAAVQQAFSEASAPAGSMATLQSISQTGGAVVIDPMISIPFVSIDCASMVTGGSVQLRSPRQIKKLRRMRDMVLRRFPQGEAYIELFKHHSPELLGLFARRPELLAGVDKVIERGLREFDEDTPEAGVLSDETAGLVERLFERLAREASPSLRRSIELATPDVRAFVGVPVKQTFERELERARGGRG